MYHCGAYKLKSPWTIWASWTLGLQQLSSLGLLLAREGKTFLSNLILLGIVLIQGDTGTCEMTSVSVSRSCVQTKQTLSCDSLTILHGGSPILWERQPHWLIFSLLICAPSIFQLFPWRFRHLGFRSDPDTKVPNCVWPLQIYSIKLENKRYEKTSHGSHPPIPRCAAAKGTTTSSSSPCRSVLQGEPNSCAAWSATGTVGCFWAIAKRVSEKP